MLRKQESDALNDRPVTSRNAVKCRSGFKQNSQVVLVLLLAYKAPVWFALG